MRKLLNTLFVTTEDSYLALENENVVIWQADERKAQYPLLMLESIISFSYKGASPALMGECAKRNIGLCFMTPHGRFLARTQGESRGNVLLRKQQYRISDQPDASCQVARNSIFGKIYNCRWLIDRTLRDHALRVNAAELKAVTLQMAHQLERISAFSDMDHLRGIEGELAARYFGVFDHLILNQKDDFAFGNRNRQPPADPVNAMLSFGYSMLAHDCAAALESVGLDAYVGFMHRDRPGRQSLALDLMEELRPVFVDRLVLTLINMRTIQAKHFNHKPGHVCLLSDEGRKVFLTAWQTHKRKEINHPYLNEKIPWGLVPYVQALLLARYIRGDLDGYPPFLWK